MVSFFSIFSSKKKAKSKGTTTGHQRPKSPTKLEARPRSSTEVKRSPSNSNNLQRPGRFRSLRSRSSNQSSDPIQRTSASAKRKSLGINGLTPPKLELGWESQPEGQAFQDMARKELAAGEIKVLDEVRFGLEDVTKGWEIFGKALRDHGAKTPGIFFSEDSQDKSTIYLCSALFSIIVKPDLADSFPSITSKLPETTPQTYQDCLSTEISRLSPPQIAEILLWISRRLDPTADGGSAAPVISSTTYMNFVASERASSYPDNAYQNCLVAGLNRVVGKYLHEVFEVFASVATFSEENSVSAGRLSLLLGLWALDPRSDIYEGWEELYTAWKETGKKVEHLFYAWIRYEASRQAMPSRLVTLVNDYPFGAASSSSTEPPVPPASSYTRKTLHVTLASENTLSKRTISPRRLLEAALSASNRSDTSTPSWSALRQSSEGANKGLNDIISDDYLPRGKEDGGKTVGESMGSQRRPLTRGVSTEEKRSRRRSQSYGDLPMVQAFKPMSNSSSLAPLDALSEEIARLPSENDIPRLSPKRQASVGMLRSESSSSNWDDFTKIGFVNPDHEKDLETALSPSHTMDSLANISSSSSHRVSIKPTAQRTISQNSAAVAHELEIYEESIIDIDDVFLTFVTQAQNDNKITQSWPSFVLVPLKESTSLTTEGSPKVEWLLITIKHVPKRPSTPEAALSVPRAMSPGAESTTSRMSSSWAFRDFASTFRRSSTSQSVNINKKNGDTTSVGRRSLFMSGARGFSKTGSGNKGDIPTLATLEESSTSASASASQPPILASAISDVPTEYTVGEMGEIVKIPSNTEAGSKSPIVDKSTTITDNEGSSSHDQSPSSNTAWSDWKYIQEGGANAVFAYTGSSPSFVGKVLRIHKSSPTDSEDEDRLNGIWKDELLPKLVPPSLLLQSEAVKLDPDWLKTLLVEAEEGRTRQRKDSGVLASRAQEAHLMENMLGSGSSASSDGSVGIKSVAFEIKPKWGFLPDGQHVHPSEAAEIKAKICRFCLHQHYRAPNASEGTAYCPMDLYSGDTDRMRKALEGLWGSWRATEGRGNNWRVYVDGKAVTPEDADLIPNSHQGGLAVISEPFVFPLLQDSKVLETIKNLQQTLDATDISDITRRCQAARPNDPAFCQESITTPSPAELRDLVETYLKDPHAGKEETETWSLRQRIIAYGLSAIFKDCSIFVKATLQSSSDNFELVKEKSSVKIIDLDLKPLYKIKDWAKLDDKLWRHWADTHRDTAISVEEPAATAEELQTPLRPKAVVGLLDTRNTATPSIRDDASTRALFAPTPGRTESPVPDTQVQQTPASQSGVSGIQEDIPDQKPDIAETTQGENEQEFLLSAKPKLETPKSRPAPISISPKGKSPVPLAPSTLEREAESFLASDAPRSSEAGDSPLTARSRLQRSTAPSPPLLTEDLASPISPVKTEEGSMLGSPSVGNGDIPTQTSDGDREGIPPMEDAHTEYPHDVGTISASEFAQPTTTRSRSPAPTEVDDPIENANVNPRSLSMPAVPTLSTTTTLPNVHPTVSAAQELLAPPVSSQPMGITPSDDSVGGRERLVSFGNSSMRGDTPSLVSDKSSISDRSGSASPVALMAMQPPSEEVDATPDADHTVDEEPATPLPRAISPVHEPAVQTGDTLEEDRAVHGGTSVAHDVHEGDDVSSQMEQEREDTDDGLYRIETLHADITATDPEGTVSDDSDNFATPLAHHTPLVTSQALPEQNDNDAMESLSEPPQNVQSVDIMPVLGAPLPTSETNDDSTSTKTLSLDPSKTAIQQSHKTTNGLGNTNAPTMPEGDSPFPERET